MSRGDSTFDFNIAQDVVRPAIFIELNFDEGDVKMWTGLGQYTLGDKGVFEGVGGLLEIGEIQETDQTESTDISITLNGIPSDFLSNVMLSEYQGRRASLFLAVLNEDGSLASYIPLFRGRMSVLIVEDSGETISVNAIIQSSLNNLLRATEKRYTDAEQKSVFPSDRGLEYIHAVKDVKIIWE